MPTYFDPSATDNFLKHCGKREIANYEQFLHVQQRKSSPLNKHTFIKRDISYFGIDVFKDVCCRLVVHGKGLIYGWTHSVIVLDFLSIKHWPCPRLLIAYASFTPVQNSLTGGGFPKQDPLWNPFPHTTNLICSRHPWIYRGKTFENLNKWKYNYESFWLKTLWQQKIFFIMSTFFVSVTMFFKSRMLQIQ